MFRKLSSHGKPSPALVISIIALVVALGGTGYAASAVGPPSTHAAKKSKKKAVKKGPKGPKGERGSKGDKGDLGPQGAKGDTGGKGDSGPGGSAVAYAHVNADGTLDRAHSKNVIDVGKDCLYATPCGQGESARQCFKLGFTPKNAVVSTGFGDASTAGRVGIPGTAADPGNVTGCPDGYTDAEVFTFKTTTGNATPASFYVLFN